MFKSVLIETLGSRPVFEVTIQAASRTRWYTTRGKTPRRLKEECEACLPWIKLVSLNQFLSFFVVILHRFRIPQLLNSCNS